MSWESVGQAEGGNFWLYSGRERLSVKWSLPYLVSSCEGDLGRPLADIALSHVFQPGDSVAVFVESVEGERAVVSRLILLVPCRRERLPLVSRVAEWALFSSRVEKFFDGEFLRIATPSLVTCPGLEPSLEPFAVGSKYLPTSPEIHLKKALALGFTDIYEIKSCFRSGEMGPHHLAEFHMLEWYRAYASLEMIQEDLQRLLSFLGVREVVRETTFSELFLEHFDFELKPTTTILELKALAGDLRIELASEDSFNDIFHRIMIEKLEPEFASMGPLVVRGFPPSMAALARLTGEGWADRFEFYWKGLEIANAFHEVNSPEEQRLRWNAELAERRHLGTSVVPDDPELIRFMEMGMPPSGGIALGLERLFMAMHEVQDIRETRLFTTSC